MAWTSGIIDEYYAKPAFNWHTRIGKFNFVGGGVSNSYSNLISDRYANGNSVWLQLVGRSGPSQVWYRAWLGFISRPTASFTPWAAAADTAGSEFTTPV